uniref:Uncharacterized protein n=1 Tax=Cynoglossus semilaevis TaxID=244447 RepID=A0A3P8V2R1_CYNSE
MAEERKLNIDEAQAPHQETGQFGILRPPHPAVGHRMHQVDAAKHVELNAHVDHFAQGATKGPVVAVGHVDGPEGQTAHQDQVCGREVAQVNLGHGAGFLVKKENHQDEDVEHDSQHGDEHDVHRLTGVQPFPALVVGTLCAVSDVFGGVMAAV